jgi:hypothetical protein
LYQNQIPSFKKTDKNTLEGRVVLCEWAWKGKKDEISHEGRKEAMSFKKITWFLSKPKTLYVQPLFQRRNVMNKKLLVVLVIVTAILVTGAWVMAAKRSAITPSSTEIKPAPENMKVQPRPATAPSIGKFTSRQNATAMPNNAPTTPLTPLPFGVSSSTTGDLGASGPPAAHTLPVGARAAYPVSPAAAQPDKVAGYRPPQHSYEGVLVQEGGEDCATAVAITVPFNSTGYTCDNYDDYEVVGVFTCPYSSTSPDVVYSYTPSADTMINIDMWGSSYDTKIWVYEDVCDNGHVVACNDDYYSNYVSAIFGLSIYSGHTYYIVVDGYGGDCGDYLIDVSYYIQCDVVCPPNGIPEGEPTCYDEYVDNYNAGCNVGPPYNFQNVNCGDTICGTSGTYLAGGGNYRDTDWFRLVLTSPTTLSWKVVAEFPLLIFIMNGGSEDCVDYTILGSATANECDTAFLSFDVPAGVYWLWAGPSVFSGVTCGKEYVGIVGCEVATMGACCNDLDPYDCSILTPDDCALLPDHTFLGLGTNCGPPNPCLPGPSNDNCEDAVVVSPPDCPAVTTVYGSTVGATIDCPGVLDWEAVWYRIDLPYATNNLKIDYCPTPGEIYTVGIVIYGECPPNCPNYILPTGYSFNVCTSGYTNPQVWWNNLPGPASYWLPVYVVDAAGNPFMDFGIDICVEQPQPCDVVCPPNGIPEGEPTCYDEYVDTYNGGCNSSPYVFQNVNCGDTICGTSGTYLVGGNQYRDTDWFRVVLTSPTTLSWKVVAEFPLLIFIMNGGSENCSDYTILGSASVAECDTAFLSFAVQPGVYWLWAGPSVFTGYPCGLEYVGIVGCPAQVGCCQLTGSCAMMTEADCNTAGGTWYASPYQCIDNQCQIPVDTLCHLQWDNDSPSWYSSGYVVGDQQANYFDPEAMCPGCAPNVYPFLLTQVSAVFYDYAANGYVDVNVHIYAADPDSCAGPGTEIYSFGPVTINTFYPDEAVVPLPEVLCLDEDFFVAFELVAPSTSPACVLWTSEPGMADCISWLWYNTYSPPWNDLKYFWGGVGYHMIRADGVCNSGACFQGTECDLVQDQGAPASYFSGLAEGDMLAKYFDPEVYCQPPVYPYFVHDVDIAIYDFMGVGSVDLQFGVSSVCHDSCDGPGTPLYLSDPITVTDMYPSMAHIVLPDPVCVYEPFFLVVRWASGVAGTTPSFLMDDDIYPCDTCHAWMFYDGYSPPWYEWSDFWSPPPPGCPILRVSGFTERPECQMEPCDTVQNVLADYGNPTWVWALPSTSGRNYPNQRFNLPASYGGRLDEVHFMFYGLTGDPNPTIYVWASDGAGHPSDNNPPYQALAEFPIPTGQIQPFPTFTVVQTWQRGVFFDPEDEFFVGYSFVFDAGDALALISDDYNDPGNTSTRAGFYWPGDVPPEWLDCFESYGIYMSFVVEAVICPEAPPESTFTLAVTPSPLYATPGDPPVHYTADIGQVLNYTLPVTLSLAGVSPDPTPGIISATFTPNGQPCPYSSDVAVTADAYVPYGTYTLTFQGDGSDGQIRTKDVTLIVQPPFDEVDVPFYHGSQKASNFGAVGNDAATDNFLWYGLTSQLFDGSFIIATTDPSTICMDEYDCAHLGWTSSQHINLYYDPTYNANVAYGNFYSEFIPGEWDSVFIVGIMETSIDFSIKIKVYYNTGPDPIMGLYPALHEDWDVGDAYNDFGDMDTLHNLMYQYDPVDPSIVFGMMKAPFYDDAMYNMVFVRNPQYVWPNAGWCTDWGLDSLYYLLTTPGYFPPAQPDTDFSILMTAPPIDLPVGGKHVEVWIDFGRDLNDGLTWQQWWHRVLRYAGFYRGDVNASDTLELPSIDASDLVYTIQYLFANGPTPKPYADQGDVNADGVVNIADCVYLINYIFIGGPAPIDYLRFIPQKWTRPSLFTNPNWR